MAGLILQCLLLVNYALISRGYRTHPAYSEDDSHDYTYDYHSHYDPRPISRIDQFDDTARYPRTGEGSHSRSIPFASDAQRVQEQERRRLKSQAREAGSFKIVNNPKPNVASRRGAGVTTKTQDNVLFPGPTQGPSQSRRDSPAPLSVPEKCMLEGICEDVPDYPQDLVDHLLSKMENGTRQFNVDELEPAAIAQRFGGAVPEEEELCSFEERLILPRAAPDREGNWYYIVNHKESKQAFRVEICHATKKSCSRHAIFTSGYDAYCKQKYALRRMVAVDNNRLIEKPFSLPTCCSCVLKPTATTYYDD